MRLTVACGPPARGRRTPIHSIRADPAALLQRALGGFPAGFCCADQLILAWLMTLPPDVSPPLAARLAAHGADLLVSPANWRPGQHGPNGEWEMRSRETGLPFVICNRTGRDAELDFRCAESLVIVEGQRRLVHRSERPRVVTFKLDNLQGRRTVSGFEVCAL